MNKREKEISNKKKGIFRPQNAKKFVPLVFIYSHERRFLVLWDHRLSLHFVSRTKKKKIKKSCPLLLPPRKRARLPPGVQVWPPPGGRSLPPITGAFLIVWFRRVGFVLYSFIIFGRKRSEVWCISNNHSVTDCPYGIFFYPRARLKGFVVHLLKEQQAAQRERAFALLSFESKRGIVVVVVVLISRQVSSFTNLIFFPHTTL